MHGGVAHLVERLAGSQEVVSSILIASTNTMKKKLIQKWPIGPEDTVCGRVDFTVPQRSLGDRYWVRITLAETEFITEWCGTAKQIDSNTWSWYRRGAEAVEVQLRNN